VPDISPRNRKGAAALSLLLAAALLAGCPRTADRPVLDNTAERLLEAKTDKALAKTVREGGKEKLAVIAVFRRDVFLGMSPVFERASFTLLNEFGNAAILLLRPEDVLPLLKDPNVHRMARFGPQGRLARIDPSLELDLLSRFGKGAEGKELPVLARFRSVPGAKEERQVEEAGFRILERGGPNLIVSGPAFAIPALLDLEWIIYIEKGNAP